MLMMGSILPFILLLTLTVSAQYKFETWTTEQGLPYKAVNSVLQTRDGYVWAATGDGLARFDGVKFTVFNTANTNGLLTNRLKFLAETADGSVWTSGEENGLFRYKNGEFSSFSIENDSPNGKILSLHADKTENRLLILTEKGLNVWQNEKFTRENLPVSIKPYTPALSDYLFNRSRKNIVFNEQPDGSNSLTKTERRILRLIAEDKTSREIGELLSIHPRTVDNHRTNISRKLNLHGSHALLRFALKHQSELAD